MTDAIYEINDKLWQGSHGALMADPNRVELLVKFDLVLMMGEGTEVCGLPETKLGWHLQFPDDANGTDERTWAYFYHLTHNVISRDAVVLTLCAMGENRSGLVSAMLLHARTGKNGGEVIEMIRGKVQPRTDQPYTIWNPGFCRQILERLT